MPTALDQIEKEARALLADRIVESLDYSEADRIDKLWASEARRRRDEVRGGRARTIAGDAALARVGRSVGR